tara:strand:+ start:663 stop:836 length:174 start_codon:yes stop_codon:yes gene_type:complete
MTVISDADDMFEVEILSSAFDDASYDSTSAILTSAAVELRQRRTMSEVLVLGHPQNI